MTDGAEPTWRFRLFGTYLILLNVFLIYVLLVVWPGDLPPSSADPVSLLGLNFNLGVEIRFLLIVMVSGALGSYIHLATSFADYVGNRRLMWSWGWWYVLRPFIGTALAIIVYFVVRGGLITGTGTATTLSPYGVAAIAGLAGMFSKQATDKLREVFENLFRTEKPPDRADRLAG